MSSYFITTRYVDRIPRKRKKRLKKAGVALSRTEGYTFVGTLQPADSCGYFYNLYISNTPYTSIR
jgi:hypothetical protein